MKSAYGYDAVLDHNGEGLWLVTTILGSLFLHGAGSKGLHDSYADYWRLNRTTP